MLNTLVKSILIFFVFLLVSVILWINYDAHFSTAAIKGERRIQNIKNIKIAMDVSQVLKIMGKPDEIVYSSSFGGNPNLTYYNYKTNDDSDPYVTICLDSLGLVNEVIGYRH